MIVVADTSPLNYLIQIACESLLPALYQSILIPAAVVAELEDPSAPAPVKQWMSRVPEWVKVRKIVGQPDAALWVLGPGEREAIQLAEEQHADLLLIDERKGRIEATRRGLATTGTLGVLLVAADRGLIDAEASYNRLMRETNFRITPTLETSFLRLVRNCG